jgi:hypothetical protein
MPRFKTREYLSEYNGMKDVIKTTHTNGSVVYHTMESPFVDLANSLGACKLNYADNEFGFYLHLFNSSNETVGVYKMTPRLRGFTQQQLADQYRKLFWCKRFNQHTKFWETYVDGRLFKADIYKEGCGFATILKEDKWSVIDRNNNYVVPPGKYDYIDGFDKCGLARVKINGKTHIFDPEKSTRDRWGIIDTKGNEVLPLVYSEIWNFYNKGLKSTTVYEGDEEDGEYIIRSIKYRFEFDKRRLVDVEAEELERTRMANLEYNYSIWDALDGEPEAVGNIDYEWL